MTKEERLKLENEFLLTKSKAQMINLYLDELDELRKQKKINKKAIDRLNSFISCCRAEKLESGSDYLHHQYWDMFENFNKQIKDILNEVK